MLEPPWLCCRARLLPLLDQHAHAAQHCLATALVNTQRQHAAQCYPPASTLAACRWRDAERFTFEHAAERLLPNTSRLSGGEVSTLMWSFATARHVHPGTFCRSWSPGTANRERSVVGTAVIAGWANGQTGRAGTITARVCSVWLVVCPMSCRAGFKGLQQQRSCCTVTLGDTSQPHGCCNPSAELFQALLQRVDVLADSLAWRVSAI